MRGPEKNDTWKICRLAPLRLINVVGKEEENKGGHYGNDFVASFLQLTSFVPSLFSVAYSIP